MKQPTSFAALGAVAKYAVRQMAPPSLRPFQTWLLFAASAAPCAGTAVCSCADASRPTGLTERSPAPASARG